jgi:hypothetical protein
MRELSLRAEVRDIVAAPPIPNSFDMIVVSHFLDRSLAPVLIEALRPEGLLFYQTFTRTAVGDVGPRQPAYRLSDQELIQLFRSLSIVVYREEGRIEDLTRGLRNEAMLVGQKVDIR